MIPKNPMQPLVLDDKGVVRFKENKIVRYLLDYATEKGVGLNEIGMMAFPINDQEQLAQLIGYSLSGFSELSYVQKETYKAACRASVILQDRDHLPSPDSPNRGSTEISDRLAALEKRVSELESQFEDMCPCIKNGNSIHVSRNCPIHGDRK